MQDQETGHRNELQPPEIEPKLVGFYNLSIAYFQVYVKSGRGTRLHHCQMLVGRAPAKTGSLFRVGRREVQMSQFADGSALEQSQFMLSDTAARHHFTSSWAL